MADLLTPFEANTLAAARDVLRKLQDRAFAATNPEPDDATVNHVYNHGVVAGNADAARDAITAALIAAKVFGDSLNAERVL